jgi:SAM-dependent methyltransferase
VTTDPIAAHQAGAGRPDGVTSDPIAAHQAGAGPPDGVRTDPIAAHQAVAPPVVASGDPAAIKQLYIALGADLWDAHARDLGEVPLLSVPETVPVVVDLLGDVRSPILDAGCGPNPALSIRLGLDRRRRPVRPLLVALDLGVGTVRLARAVAARAGVAVCGVVADVEALPFRRGAFAGVACDDTIEHVPDDHVAVSELSRVTRAGGAVVIATPNRTNARIALHKIRDRVRGIRRPASAYFVSKSHLREYSWPELEGLVRPAVRITGRASVGWWTGWRGPGWAALATRALRLGPLRRGSQMIVIRGTPR